MGKKRGDPKDPQKGRLLWSSGGLRLFDPAGQEFHRATTDLARAEVEQVLAEGFTSVAVILCGAGVTWAEGPDRRALWEKQVRQDFEDVADWRPPHDAPGTLPIATRCRTNRLSNWRPASDRH